MRCFIMEPAEPSSRYDIYYIETDDGNGEALHSGETEEDQVEESINPDDLPSTAGLLEQENTAQLFTLNSNSQRQQPSPYKK